MGKPFWQSKTLWLNAVGLAVVVLEYLGTINIGDPKLLTSILAVLNFALRFKTDEPVKLSM